MAGVLGCRLLAVVLSLLIHASHVSGFSPFGVIANVMESVQEKTSNVINHIPDFVPTATAIFDAKKNALMGFPFETLAKIIHTVCSTVMASPERRSKFTPDIRKMKFQLRVGCERLNFPFLQAYKMYEHPHFNVSKKVVVLATGWLSAGCESIAMQSITQAYNCRGDVNFVVLDAASYVSTLYSWSALNTLAIGRAMAKSLMELIQKVPVENIHLIGHSLGAHICGYAGRYFQVMTNKTLPRITALDPAMPCFNEGEELSGIQRGDADFVDVIHSNSGVLGKKEPTGDVDFYPNGVNALPSGCFTIICAHSRAWEYYAESVYPGNEKNFMGKRCSSLNRLRSSLCPGKSYPMGYATPTNIKGNYFLEVNENSPYGKDAKKHPIKFHKTCGLC